MPRKRITIPCPDCGRSFAGIGKRCARCANLLVASQRRQRDVSPPNPSGFCACGCGQVTKVAPYTSESLGWVRGHPIRFVTGHNMRHLPDPPYTIEDRGHETPCWIWAGVLNENGYGSCPAKWSERGTSRAHIVFYERQNGPVPNGLDLDHRCRVRNCVNPDHMEPVTRAINIQRGRSAKLTPAIVREIRALAATTPPSELALRFRVGQRAIWQVVARRTWKNVA